MLIALARAQLQVGRVAEAIGAFDTALELARGRDDKLMLRNVLDAEEIEAGLTANAEVIWVQELPTARSIAERAELLYRIALAQERMGRREDAVATYREALPATDAIPSTSTRTNVLAMLLGPMLVGTPQPARLIAESAPQAARITQSIESELRRSSALVLIARALPN